MLRAFLLSMLVLACAAPAESPSFRLDGIEWGPVRDADDPARVEARRIVDRAVFQGVPTRADVFTNQVADGCPEGWMALFYLAPVQGRERAEFQRDALDRIADIDPDDEWFVDHIAWTWVSAEATTDPDESLAGQLRSKLAYVEAPLARLATHARRPDVRAAAAGALGRMLIYGNLPAADGADAIARGVGYLRGALAIWSADVDTPGVLALREPRTSQNACDELEDLIVAAEGRGLGRRLATISILDEDGRRVGIDDALGDRAAVVVVWGFT